MVKRVRAYAGHLRSSYRSHNEIAASLAILFTCDVVRGAQVITSLKARARFNSPTAVKPLAQLPDEPSTSDRFIGILCHPECSGPTSTCRYC